MNRKALIVLAIVLVILLGWWISRSDRATAPSGDVAQNTMPADDLVGLDSRELENDLQAIDADLNQL